jgi:DNA-binding NarL/FixJ family response regulator
MKRITVLLADDNKGVRGEFRDLVELEGDFEMIGEAKNGRQAVAMVKKLRPAVVLMDIAMPVLNGVQATLQILKALPGTKVLMLSAHSEDVYVEASTRAGAMGYLVKQTAAESLSSAIREVQKGNMFFSSSISSYLRMEHRRQEVT